MKGCTVEGELGVASFLVNYFLAQSISRHLWLCTPVQLYSKVPLLSGANSCPHAQAYKYNQEQNVLFFIELMARTRNSPKWLFEPEGICYCQPKYQL